MPQRIFDEVFEMRLNIHPLWVHLSVFYVLNNVLRDDGVALSQIKRNCAPTSCRVTRTTSSRLQKKLEPRVPMSCRYDTRVDAIVDFPAPGLPVSKKTLGA